jgi:hypothetical protein
VAAAAQAGAQTEQRQGQDYLGDDDECGHWFLVSLQVLYYPWVLWCRMMGDHHITP